MRLAAASLLMVSAFTIAATAPAMSSTRAGGVSLVELLPEELLTECAYVCESCGSKHSSHRADQEVPNAAAQHDEFCEPGPCGAHLCGGVTLVPFEEALRAATVAQVRDLLDASEGQHIVLNEKRSAVQVVGCNGLVIASYPTTGTGI